MGVGVGWGFGLALGTRYIDSKPRFEGIDLAKLGDVVLTPQAEGHKAA